MDGNDIAGLEFGGGIEGAEEWRLNKLRASQRGLIESSSPPSAYLSAMHLCSEKFGLST